MSKAPALSRDRIVEAAVAVADGGGLSAVSMRNVGDQLGVRAMSLYHHVANKDEILDALADWVFAQIWLPELDDPWRPAMVARADSARAVLFEHGWALGLIESRRNPGPALLRHHDTVLGCLLANGFSMRLASHAFSVLDAYIYGFVVTELSLPFAPDEGAADFAAELDLPFEAYPHMARMLTELVFTDSYDFGDEFGYGLHLILDQLDSRLTADLL